MTYTCFNLSIEDQIAHIVLSRPEKRNAMSSEFWTELPDIVRDIDKNSKARVIVISSTGPHFTAGIDLAAFSLGSSSSLSREERLQAGAKFLGEVKLMQETFSCLEDCRIPVISAIQGGCIGGGVDLITACDMRYGTEDSFITIFETMIGMTADVGTFPRITKLIPEGIARELAYTGRRMPAVECKEFGLFNQLFANQDEMMTFVMKKAQEIAARAPLAVMGCKRIITYSRDHSTADTLDYIATWNASMLLKEEIGEAVQANQEKRPGKFVERPKLTGFIG